MLSFRGTWTGWRNGLARTSRSSTRRNPKSCTWEGRNLGTNTVHQGHQLESSLAEKDLKVLVDTKSVYSAKLFAVVFNHRTRGNGKKMETREIMSEHQETLCVGDWTPEQFTQKSCVISLLANIHSFFPPFFPSIINGRVKENWEVKL